MIYLGAYGIIPFRAQRDSEKGPIQAELQIDVSRERTAFGSGRGGGAYTNVRGQI